MRTYRPSVTCHAPLTRSPLVPHSFNWLSAQFPASKDPKVFGKVSRGIDIKLPWVGLRPPSRAPLHKAVSIIVNTSYAMDTSSWFDIYVALMATWAMCGWDGRGGIAENIGM